MVCQCVAPLSPAGTPVAPGPGAAAGSSPCVAVPGANLAHGCHGLRKAETEAARRCVSTLAEAEEKDESVCLMQSRIKATQGADTVPAINRRKRLPAWLVAIKTWLNLRSLQRNIKTYNR